MSKVLSPEQKVFNKVARHLLRQGKKSLTKGTPLCAYRGEGGTRCAVGCLVPNHVYIQRIERLNVYALDGDVGQHLDKLVVTRGFLSQLQKIHDSYMTTEWSKKLREFASANGLNMPDLAGRA